MSVTSYAHLQANLNSAESVNVGSGIQPQATGFKVTFTGTDYNASGSTYIYMAIRRPNKPPTSGTKVFTPTLATFSGTTVTDTGYVVDMVINKNGVAVSGSNFVLDRLRGSNNGAEQKTISTDSGNAEATSSGRVAITGSVTIQNGFLEKSVVANNIVWSFARAPGFFDVVCYTGTGVATTQAHNLGVAPELMIVKSRNDVNNWCVYTPAIGINYVAYLNWTDAKYGPYSPGLWNNTTPTASVFSLSGSGWGVNNSAVTYVAYLFATLAGISKVGSYIGNGGTQNIDCGFAAGARFILIKCTSTTGDWFVWDSARGIVAANDPHLSLNTDATEVTTDDSIDPYSAGFTVNQLSATNINVSSATYIFLAIA